MLHVREHLLLAGTALAAALAIGIPLGTLSARLRIAGGVALSAFTVARTIPSLAILALLISVVGVGFVPSVIALSLLAIPPVAINTNLGLRSIPATIREAAQGLGMSEREVRTRVDWPLAAPLVFSGVHTAAVESLASATLAAFVGGGGLGVLVIDGLANNDYPPLLLGAGTIAAMTVIAEIALSAVE